MNISPKNYVYYFMRKEKSIFVTEGYLLREVIPIMFLKDGNRGYVIKINVFLSGTAQITKIARSFTKRLISREDFFVRVFIKKTEFGFVKYVATDCSSYMLISMAAIHS